jgi:hypothetical protein
MYNYLKKAAKRITNVNDMILPVFILSMSPPAIATRRER